MFQHVVELHVVDLTCKNVHNKETTVVLRNRIWMGEENLGDNRIWMGDK